MKKIILTVVLAIGMIASTFANENTIKVEENKLHFSYYSPNVYQGILIDKTSQLILETDKGISIVLSTDYNVKSQKGYKSESIALSYDLTEQETELLKDSKIVELKLRHNNGTHQATIESPKKEI